MEPKRNMEIERSMCALFGSIVGVLGSGRLEGVGRSLLHSVYSNHTNPDGGKHLLFDAFLLLEFMYSGQYNGVVGGHRKGLCRRVWPQFGPQGGLAGADRLLFREIT